MASATKVISITTFPQVLPAVKKTNRAQFSDFEQPSCDICGSIRELRHIGGVDVCMMEVSEADWEAAKPYFHTHTSEGLPLAAPMTTQEACALGIDLYGERQ
jgi:hypothetical protein